MQGFVPVMWSVWGFVVLVLVALKVYSGRLSRDEDDQIILDDSFNHVRSEQAAIIEKVHKIEPIQRAAMWGALAMTLVVIGYYAFDMFSQFK
jgi:uncharacterized membrane protein YjfL (UPF0719 family)